MMTELMHQIRKTLRLCVFTKSMGVQSETTSLDCTVTEERSETIMGSLSKKESLDLIPCRNHLQLQNHSSNLWWWCDLKGDWIRVIDWVYCTSNRYRHIDVVIEKEGSGDSKDTQQVRIADIFYLDAKEWKKPENNALAVHNLTLLSIEKKKENRRLKEERELEDKLLGITKRILSCAEDGKFSVFIEGNDLINPEGRFSESAVERELRNSGYRLEIAMDAVPVHEGSNRMIWKKGMRIYWDMKEPDMPKVGYPRCSIP